MFCRSLEREYWYAVLFFQSLPSTTPVTKFLEKLKEVIIIELSVHVHSENAFTLVLPPNEVYTMSDAMIECTVEAFMLR